MPSMPGQAQVEDDHLGPQPVERGQAGLAAQLPGDLVAQALEIVPDAAQNVDIVVDEEDGSGHADYLSSPGDHTPSDAGGEIPALPLPRDDRN